MNRRGLTYTVIFTFLAAFVFVAVLALTAEGTRPRVELNQRLLETRAILEALGIEYPAPDQIPGIYEERVRERTEEDFTFYEAAVDGNTRWAVRFSGAGLWGTITGVLALNEELSRIVGFEIVDHNETPGLGGRISEDWFSEQFDGERIPDGTIGIRGDGDTDPENGVVDAVTGATRTSQALEGILNRYIRSLQGALQ